jgi:electron transfer flavoprotein alpha subunit
MILLVVEHSNGKVSKSTLEMTTAARGMGREGPVTLLVLGSGVAPVAEQAAAFADQVLVADKPELAQYDPEVWASAVAQIAREGEAHTVLIGGSRSGREYSPRVAVKLDAPLIEDAISITDRNGALVAAHYTFLSRVTETVAAEGPVCVVTVKPGSFAAAQPASAAGEQYDAELALPTPRLRVTGQTAEKSERMDSPEGFKQLVEGLADQLGAAVGATRAIVDAGWRPYSEQVGQTGKTVQPKAYIAVGISGAVQHLSGMNKSKFIVAINKDANAPIFKIADYGIVGDVHQIIPAMIAELRK